MTALFDVRSLIGESRKMVNGNVDFACQRKNFNLLFPISQFYVIMYHVSRKSSVCDAVTDI